MYDAGIPVPQPRELIENIVVMEFIPNPLDSSQPAPLLHIVDKEWIIDPEETFYESVDILVRIFHEAKYTHGDYNDHNLMVTSNGIMTMDVTQSMPYNVKTYIDTPVRIRIDRAVAIFRQDLLNLNQNFIQRFRVSGDVEYIYQSTIDQLSEKLQEFIRGRQEITSYSNYAPEIYSLKENQRKMGVRRRSNRNYQRKKR